MPLCEGHLYNRGFAFAVSNYNPRPSARSITTLPLRPREFVLLQLTPLYEGHFQTFCIIYGDTLLQLSPLYGGFVVRERLHQNDYNSRPSARGIRYDSLALRCACRLQLSPPPRGTSIARLSTSPVALQLTPPLRGHLLRDAEDTYIASITTHAPLRGASPVHTPTARPLLRQWYTVQCEALGGEELPLLLSCIKIKQLNNSWIFLRVLIF